MKGCPKIFVLKYMFNLTWVSTTETNAPPKFWSLPTQLHRVTTQKTPIFNVLKPQTNIILPVPVFTDINKYFYFITLITAISPSSTWAKDNYLKLSTKHSRVWHSKSQLATCQVWHTLYYIINSKSKMMKMATTPAIILTWITCWHILRILTQLPFNQINKLHIPQAH